MRERSPTTHLPSPRRGGALGLAASWLAAAVVTVALPQAAEAFPDREITLIVNYGAGGTTDLSARVLAEAAEEILGQPIRVENRTGGSGTVGPTFVANGEPDGYTIGIASFSPMAVTPHLQEVPYTLDDFAFIAGYARYRAGIAVSVDSEFETLEDLLAAAQVEPLTYATTSSQEDVLMARLNRATGGTFDRVSYRSGQESVTAVISGVVDITSENPVNILPHVRNGTLRLLASTASVRWFEMPDVPTLQEQGVDVVSESYAGLAAPAGTPADIIAVLEDAFAQALDDPTVQETIMELGMEPIYFTSEEYRILLEQGRAAMAVDLAAIGLIDN